jgi:hypothetical protein
MSEMKHIKTEEDEAFEYLELTNRWHKEFNKPETPTSDVKFTKWELEYLCGLVEDDYASIIKWGITPDSEVIHRGLLEVQSKLQKLLP